MTNWLTQYKQHLKQIPYFANTCNRVKTRWQVLGTFNRGLVVAAFVISLLIMFTTYSIASERYALREIQCLALNIYHEARGEPVNGQYAVATVTMNRVDSDRYPDDVCRVVYQRGWSHKHRRYISAFSWTNVVNLSSIIPEEQLAWDSALTIARKVYNENHRSKKVGEALFYHADYVSPSWSSEKTRLTKIGQHIFYH